MPKTDWALLTANPGRCHLVVACVPPDEEDAIQTPRVRMSMAMLTRLCQRDTKGTFALAVVRDRVGVELHCAFDDEADAERVASVLRASAVKRPLQWATRLDVLLDEDAHERVFQNIGAARIRRRWPPSPGSR